jgi:hypothetical protein
MQNNIRGAYNLKVESMNAESINAYNVQKSHSGIQIFLLLRSPCTISKPYHNFLLEIEQRGEKERKINNAKYNGHIVGSLTHALCLDQFFISIRYTYKHGHTSETVKGSLIKPLNILKIPNVYFISIYRI